MLLNNHENMESKLDPYHIQAITFCSIGSVVRSIIEQVSTLNNIVLDTCLLSVNCATHNSNHRKYSMATKKQYLAYKA